MAPRLTITAGLAALALAVATGPAEASVVLGSEDPGAAPSDSACAGGCPDPVVGFRQLGLAGAVVEAPEDGVLVSASAHLRRTAGSEPPVVVVLRPDVGLGATIVARAPMPAVPTGDGLRGVEDLHLPVEAGDSLGLLVRPDEVQLGVRSRPSPDGAVVRLTDPCAPCGADGGTGRELLLSGTVEPDADADLLGDETQDPDGGGLVEEEPFGPGEDFFEDEFGEDEFGEDDPAEPRRPRRLRLLRVLTGRGGAITLVLRAPGPGRLTAGARVPAAEDRRIAQASTRVPRAGRIRLRLVPSAAGRRLLARPGPLRVRVRVSFRSRAGRRQALSRTLTIGAARPR